MTICDYPEYLAVGFLFNQNMITSLNELKSVEFDEDLSVVVVRTNKTTPFETNNKKRIKTSGCAMEPYLVKCSKKFYLYHLKN